MSILFILIGCATDQSNNLNQTQSSLTVKSVIYDNGSLGSGWNIYCCGTQVYNSSSVTLDGELTWQSTINRWSHVNPCTSSGVSAAEDDVLSFDVYGGSTTPNIAVRTTYSGTRNSLSSSFFCDGDLVANTWVHCAFPFSELGGAQTVSDIYFSNEGSSTYTVAFANMEIVEDYVSGSGGAGGAGGVSSAGSAGIVNGGSAGTVAGSAGVIETGGTSGVAGSVISTGGTVSTGGVTSTGGIEETGGVATGGASTGGAGTGGTVQGYMEHIGVGNPSYSNTGTASLVNDGKYGLPYYLSLSNCSESSPCWAAVNVGTGPDEILVQFSYESGSYIVSNTSVHDYTMLVSSDSTNGSDGTWVPATDVYTDDDVDVSGNTYTFRAHQIEFTGYSWVKLSITDTDANWIEEMEIWDADNGTQDSYFFHGDSITNRCARRPSDSGWNEAPSFQDLFSGDDRFPIAINGGSVGQGASFAVNQIDGLLNAFPMVEYWFFLMGTNDFCYTSTSAFESYAETWYDAVTAAGKTPILVHPIWGNDVSGYCSDNGPSFNTAIDSALSGYASALPVVELYEAFYGHSEYFGSGDVHPTYSTSTNNGCNVWGEVFYDYVMDNNL